MAHTQAWNSGPVTLIEGKDNVLALRPTQPGDNPAMIFKTDEVDILFATMVANKLPVRAKHIWLRGDDGGIAAEIEAEGKNGKAFNYAYTPEQLASFTAKSFSLREKPAYRGKEPIPVLFAFSTEKPETTKKTGLVRAERAEPAKPTLQRAAKR